jgi:uncharacterized protein
MKAETFQQLIDSITPDVYERLRAAVEIGKWANGIALTEEQKSLSMQAVISFEIKHLPPEQRTGYVPPKPASACAHEDDEKPLTWRE